MSRQAGNRLQRVEALAEVPDLSGQVALVTGATDGVGEAVAHQLAKTEAVILIAARDQAKGARVRDEIRNATGTEMVEVVELDLANLISVREARRQQSRSAGTGSTFSAASPAPWGTAPGPRPPTASR